MQQLPSDPARADTAGSVAPITAQFNLILDGSHRYVANSLIVHNRDGGGSRGSGNGSGGGSNSGESGGGNDSNHDSGDDHGKGEHA